MKPQGKRKTTSAWKFIVGYVADREGTAEKNLDGEKRRVSYRAFLQTGIKTTDIRLNSTERKHGR